MARTRLTFLLLTWTAMAAAQEKPTDVPKVESSSGIWKLGAGDIPEDGVLPLGAQVDGKPSANGTAEVLVRCPNDLYLNYTCTRNCRVPVCDEHLDGIAVHRIDLQQNTRGKVTTLGSLFESLWKRTPVTTVIPLARAGGNPNDAVVLLKSATLNLGPTLRRIVEGKYCFSLKALPSTGSTSTVFLDWDRTVDPAGAVPAGSLRPGTYELAKGTPGDGGLCQLDSDGVPAWVLVTSERNYTSANAAWTAYSASLLELEKTGVSQDILRTLRHAALSGIADSMEAQ